MKGSTLKEALRDARRTQAELAEFMNTTQQNVAGLLSQDNIKTETLEAVAQFLGRSAASFYGGEDVISQGEGIRVPLIPIEAHAGSLQEFAESVKDYDCEMIVSPVKGATFAIQVTGDSMAPAYPSGARILCQRINEAAFVDWGRVYLLDTVNGAILKQVRKSETLGCVTCCSLNPSPEYAPFELETQYIRAWYRVLMIMSLV
jgi:phage repressor protein C with HTH and peptisase S24 domain